MTMPVPNSGSTSSSVIILTVRFVVGILAVFPMRCL